MFVGEVEEWVLDLIHMVHVSYKLVLILRAFSYLIVVIVTVMVNDDVYGAVVWAPPLGEFTRFI